ncbi:MAG: hypothetical protein ACRD3Y_03610, partial [Bryobacteraceae bacterium]
MDQIVQLYMDRQRALNMRGDRAHKRQKFQDQFIAPRGTAFGLLLGKCEFGGSSVHVFFSPPWAVARSAFAGEKACG